MTQQKTIYSPVTQDDNTVYIQTSKEKPSQHNKDQCIGVVVMSFLILFGMCMIALIVWAVIPSINIGDTVINSISNAKTTLPSTSIPQNYTNNLILGRLKEGLSGNGTNANHLITSTSTNISSNIPHSSSVTELASQTATSVYNIIPNVTTTITSLFPKCKQMIDLNHVKGALPLNNMFFSKDSELSSMTSPCETHVNKLEFLRYDETNKCIETLKPSNNTFEFLCHAPANFKNCVIETYNFLTKKTTYNALDFEYAEQYPKRANSPSCTQNN